MGGGGGVLGGVWMLSEARVACAGALGFVGGGGRGWYGVRSRKCRDHDCYVIHRLVHTICCPLQWNNYQSVQDTQV